MRLLLVRWNRYAYVACCFATSVLLATLVVTNLAEMTARGVFDTSLSWVFEVNVLLAVWLYFLAIYQVYFRRSDISVDLLVRKFPAGLRRASELVVDVAIVVVLVMLSWQAVKLILVQLPYKTPGIAIPSALFTAPVLIGSILMALTMLERLLQRAAGREEAKAGVGVGAYE